MTFNAPQIILTTEFLDWEPINNLYHTYCGFSLFTSYVYFSVIFHLLNKLEDCCCFLNTGMPFTIWIYIQFIKYAMQRILINYLSVARVTFCKVWYFLKIGFQIAWWETLTIYGEIICGLSHIDFIRIVLQYLSMNDTKRDGICPTRAYQVFKYHQGWNI